MNLQVKKVDPNVMEPNEPISLSGLKNVLMICLDDVGRYDIENVDLPNIHALRDSSLIMGAGYVGSSMCSPSRVAAMTGQYGRRVGIGRIVQKTEQHDLPLGTPTLANLFDAAGFKTCMVGKWHKSSGLNYSLLDSPGLFGFDNWRAVATQNLGVDLSDGSGPGSFSKWDRVDDGVNTLTTEYPTEAQAEAAIDWWQANPTQKKFLWLAFNAAHEPFHVPPASLLPAGYPTPTTNREMFEADLIAADNRIGHMFANMDLSDTLIVFWADNGTPPDATAPFQDPAKVKQTMYEGGIAAPIYIKYPGLQARTSRRMMSMVDFFATFGHLLGSTFPCPPDSKSFADLLGAVGSAPQREFVFAERFGPNGVFVPLGMLPAPSSFGLREYMIRKGSFKMIVKETGNGNVISKELYELPDEVNQITDPAKLAELVADYESL